MSEKKGLTRRAFVASVAAGAAVLAHGGSARAAAKKTTRRAASSGAAPSAAVRAEIAKQKKSTADLLQTIRKHPLPAGGGEIGFVFRPMLPKGEGGDK